MSKVESTDTSMGTHSAGYDDAFRRWKSARTTLTCAISDYLAASSGLFDALSSPACRSASCFSLEQALFGIDLELSSLQSEEERLKQTRTTLANERNRSRALSPAHKLPPEILATIFVVATSRYTRHDRTASARTYSSPTVLSAVSSSWRHIALGAPSLWAYIDIIVGGDSHSLHFEQPELWIERSSNTTLHVNIQEYEPSFTRNTFPRYQVDRVLELLSPLMHRVRTLEMSGSLQAHNMLSSVLALWAKHTSTGTKRTLQIVNIPSYKNRDTTLGPASDGSFSVEDFNVFFRSFNRLLVQNCRISESVVFHEGLVELHLEGIDTPRSPTQRELVAMLATTPRLRILVLANCWIEPSGGVPSPVALDHLQFLSLESETDSHGFVHVLPLLTIGSEGLSMSMTLDDECDFVDEARGFFGRTKVTRLHVWGIRGHIPLFMLLYPLPHLETLALDYFDISTEDGHTMIPWPRLRTLYLQNSSIDTSCLQQLVQLHRSLNKLHVYAPVTTDRWTEKSMTDEECAHLAESMRMVEDFKIESDWGSLTTAAWDFVILDPY